MLLSQGQCLKVHATLCACWRLCKQPARALCSALNLQNTAKNDYEKLAVNNSRLKMQAKHSLDLVMTGLILLAMSPHLTGNTVHEGLGILLFLLFILHNLINRRWYQSMFKGKYQLVRVLNALINCLLIIALLTLLVTGILISQAMFTFLTLNGGLLARQIHTLAAHWSLIFVGAHLGMHWAIIFHKIHQNIQKASGNSNKNSVPCRILRFLLLIIVGLGIVASFNKEIGAKLVMNSSFSLWNENEFRFAAEYLLIFVTYVCVAHYTLKLIQKPKSSVQSKLPK